VKLLRLRLDQLSRMPQRERLLLVGCCVVVSVVLLDRLAISPWWQHRQRVREDIARLEQRIIAYRRLLDRKGRIVAEADAYRDYLPSAVAAPVDMASLLREIETYGGDSGIALGEVKPLTAGGGEEGRVAPVLEIRCRGTLQQWVRFVHLLESSTALFEIQRAALAMGESGDESLEGSLRLSTIMFFDTSGGSSTSQSKLSSASPS